MSKKKGIIVEIILKGNFNLSYYLFFFMYVNEGNLDTMIIVTCHSISPNEYSVGVLIKHRKCFFLLNPFYFLVAPMF